MALFVTKKNPWGSTCQETNFVSQYENFRDPSSIQTLSFFKTHLGVSETENEITISLSPRGFARLIYNSLWGTLARLLLRSLQLI